MGNDNWAGARLRIFMEDNYLALANTWRRQAAGPTFAGGRGEFTRIDFIDLPFYKLIDVTQVKSLRPSTTVINSVSMS
eukprot:2028647-Heterocapsa_arctica.AAC.1